MFYKLDLLTNRIRRTSPLEALYPAGITPPTRDLFKEPEFYFENSHIKPVKLELDVRHTLNAGAMSTSAAHAAAASATAHNIGAGSLGVVPAAPGYAKISEMQKKWSIHVHDGLMIWQKRGAIDMGPYYLTIGLCGVGIAYSCFLIYQMSFPKKAE